MAWYKTGTVSVVSGETSITGIGTKFASNSRVGDGFRGPDGEWYEIVNIASETVLGIFPAYQGSTVSTSASYMIAPLQGYNKESADRLREITNGMADISGDVLEAKNSAIEAKASEDAAKAYELSVSASALDVSQKASQVTTDALQVSQDRTAAQAAAVESGIARDEAVAAAGTVVGVVTDMGTIDLSGGVYPAKPNTSSFWRVVVGGTVSGTIYAVGDTLNYSKPADEFYKSGGGAVASVNGQTGTVVLAKGDIGLGNVDNTSDANKPVSTAQQTALDAKVDKVTGKQLSTEDYTSAEKTKLAGVAAGATANSPNATLLDRANHTGTQLASTISDLSAAVRLVTLLGLDVSSAVAAVEGDTFLTAVGKLQAQVTARAMKGVNSDITRLTAIDATGFGVLRDGLPVVIGATSSVAGTKGLVPAPGILGANAKFLSDKGIFEEAGGSGDNVGDIKPWKYSRSTIPGGRLPHDGQIVTNGRTLYPEFWALIQPFCVTDAVWLAAPYDKRGLPSLGNGTTDFRMPDDNGKHPDGSTIAAMVLRGDGKNSAGTPGWHQADQMQRHKHPTPLGDTDTSTKVDGADALTGTVRTLNASAVITALRALTGLPYTGPDAGNVPSGGNARAGNETRGSSTTVIWTSVVAKTAVNPGTVDVTVLSNTVNANTVAIDGKLGKPFVSSPQVITSAGALTITHGLPSVSNVRYTLVCITAEAGYTADQRISDVGWQAQVTTAANKGVSFSWSGSGDVSLMFGSLPSTFAALHATTGVYTALTNANWRIEVSVYP